MNKPRIFPKSKIEGSNFKMCKLNKCFISMIGYIFINHLETYNTLFTIIKSEITLAFVQKKKNLPQYLHYLTPLNFSERKTISYGFDCNCLL